MTPDMRETPLRAHCATILVVLLQLQPHCHNVLPAGKVCVPVSNRVATVLLVEYCTALVSGVLYCTHVRGFGKGPWPALHLGCSKEL